MYLLIDEHRCRDVTNEGRNKDYREEERRILDPHFLTSMELRDEWDRLYCRKTRTVFREFRVLLSFFLKDLCFWWRVIERLQSQKFLLVVIWEFNVNYICYWRTVSSVKLFDSIFRFLQSRGSVYGFGDSIMTCTSFKSFLLPLSRPSTTFLQDYNRWRVPEYFVKTSQGTRLNLGNTVWRVTPWRS